MKQSTLLDNRLEDKNWQQYCSFIKLSVEEFQAIQNELLEESLEFLTSSQLGKMLLKGKKPRGIYELQSVAKITTYDDYNHLFSSQNTDGLPERPIYWAYTSTSGGHGKQIPFTFSSHNVMLDYLMSAFILASSSTYGQSIVNAGDVAIYNVAPRPFLSGYMGIGINSKFGIRVIPPLETAESMDITERVEKAFQMALRSGVDIVCCLSSVLVKMGETLADQQAKSQFSLSYLHPSILLRMVQAYIDSHQQNRTILPKDLWKPKALIGWGLDTSLYRDKIEYYWGKTPYEFHACTEAGILALQSWNKKGLILAPKTAFYEFIPEEEWLYSRNNPDYNPETVLINELETGKRYELVITSFHGMPLIRYRLGHIIKVISMDDPETGCTLPQIAYVGRSDDVIDIAGFTRLDEKTLWQAISLSQPDCFNWVAAKEYYDHTAILHVYLETKEPVKEQEAYERLHSNLKQLDSAYSNLESMLGQSPLQVSLLADGTFQRYYQERQKLGESQFESHLPHINPPQAALEQLLRSNNSTKK